MLTWDGPDEDGVFRATDRLALYVIAPEGAGFRVGFFPAPGPECPWGVPLASVESAKAAAEDCAAHVRSIRGPRDGDASA